MAGVDTKSLTYLAKKLFNLTTLLEQDTACDDVSYPTFALESARGFVC